MIKELKYLLFIIVIFFFIFFNLRYYFSDDNQKNFFTAEQLLNQKIKDTEDSLILLENDTENIIEFVEYKNNKKTKKYSFWKLLHND